VKAVDVLRGSNGAQDEPGVDVSRQRHLAKDAVNGRILVERGDQRQNFSLAALCRQTVLEAGDADFRAFLDLAADINFARGIVADEDHRQAGPGMAGGYERIDLRLRFGVELFGDGASVDDIGHRFFPVLWLRGAHAINAWRRSH
jgi:hypothetical protein